jgi:hypothetical protein
MPIGDNARKGPRGKYTNIRLPKDEYMKMLEEQRSKYDEGFDRVSQRLRDQRIKSEERDQQRRINKKKDKDKTRAKNKSDYYD